MEKSCVKGEITIIYIWFDSIEKDGLFCVWHFLLNGKLLYIYTIYIQTDYNY